MPEEECRHDPGSRRPWWRRKEGPLQTRAGALQIILEAPRLTGS